ncbi:MAG: protein kinase [Myxococcota bacterium]|nr:protein kinase [Myxococcota bacterium]
MKEEDDAFDPTLTPNQVSVDDSETELQQGTNDSSPSKDDHPPDASMPGYHLRRKIGIGGMGEVVLARDTKLERDVAIKRLRSARPSEATVKRFLREAKIQARLDHPAIVPVHELGNDNHGQPYFTMKRLTGTTLAAHLKQRTKTQQELLRAFVDVCLAMDFAHKRAVVHRDLKPGNVMLGDFGEVYVIDWGVARMLDEKEAISLQTSPSPLEEGMTQEGTLLGTPGYMAPEQIDGANEVGPSADIYALGATLFEILSGEPLHPRGGDALIATLGEYDPLPSHRARERQIAPELDELTRRALSPEAADRPSARSLADGVQRYLDGDRDVERRRALSVVELASAQAALVGGDVARRAEAIRSAGRALALDPESREAAALISRLMLEPPKQQPEQLSADLAASENQMQQKQGRVAVKSLVAVLVFLGAAAITGVRSVPVILGIAGWASLVLVLAYLFSRRPARPHEMWIIAIGNALLCAMLSRLFGPLIITPVASCIIAVSLTSYPQLMAHARIVIPMLVLAWIGPVLLEYAGALRPTWTVIDGAVVSTSHAIELSGTATSALLIFGNCMAIIVVGAFANALARSRREAQRSVEIQAWHLKQLLPMS